MWKRAANTPRDLLGALTHLTRWPEHSQQIARRNALIASTALAERRRERVEVDEFLERHLAGRPRLEGSA